MNIRIKMFLKKAFLLIMFVLGVSFFFCGCDKEKPGIFFSSSPFSKETGYTPKGIFQKGERIYYLLYNPKEFQTRLIKVQVFRKDDEADEFWGYEYLYNKTVELTDKKVYTDYFVINKKGIYMFQVFDYINTLKPVMRGVVRVVD